MAPSMSPDESYGADSYNGNHTNGSSSGANDGVRLDDSSSNPNAGIPRQKRLACLICRRRKLKCDGRRPSCSTCARLGHSCAYDEVRKKSGPKRGYVKALEERLKQVEVMLKSQDGHAGNTAGAEPRLVSAAGKSATAGSAGSSSNLSKGMTPSVGRAASGSNPSTSNGVGVNGGAGAEFAAGATDPAIGMPGGGGGAGRDMDRWQFNADSPSRPNSLDDFNFSSRMSANMTGVDSNVTWELVNLGLEEPLPDQTIIDELAPNQRPPICLRYAMWMLACTVTDEYSGLKDLFYQRARKIGLHRLDGEGLEVKQCIPPPRDWTEMEERRRTFWMAFCEDRYASIGTGWPMIVDERDITTVLPSSEEAFEMSREEPGVALQEAMCPAGVGQLTPFAGIVLMACLFGRNLIHLHRPDHDNKDDNLNGEFWKRHRNLDNILLNTLLGLPAHLKLPSGLHNPNIVFTNMCIHTSTICLHQAAIFKAEKNGLDSSVSPESKVRCISAANEIASIMRMVSHMDLSSMNPFISFCLYVAARVFVQFLKSRPDESQTADSLRFLLTAMNALKRRNPLTESFLVQLDVDLEALGERFPRLKSAFPLSTDSPSSGMPAGLNPRAGAVCEEGAVDGILSYQREFSKSTDNTPNNGKAGESNFNPERLSGSSPMGSGTSPNGGASATGRSATSQQWLGQESRLPTRDRSAGHSPVFQMATNTYPDPSVNAMLTAGQTTMPGFVDELQDMSTPSGDGTSNRPTPNSSAASEHRQTLVLPQPGGQMHSGSSSFDASPVSPPRVLVNGRQGARVDGSTGNYFATGNGVPAEYAPASSGPSAAAAAAAAAAASAMNGGGGTLGGLMGADPSSNSYPMPHDWNLQGQTAMTPVSEGVLRTIIQMGPMETMDLGWGSNQ
ncbi:c6 zinc finger domain containing protein [Niveomyces insectorum RCEF 264]|uniref:C6 zinc finger domain containing protein n=1 Tax=Niveomyces insectorum RCEF 264 TaxID=1081102 RepID=A0A162MBD7_9HYPO|nr:c6 zinc finger domain containing protein [Niveomyces insectorum RCEF 264]